MTNPDPTYVDPAVETPISATEELAAMLDHKQHIAPELVEEPIELEGESDSATLNWGVIAPAALIIVAVVVWGLFFPASFSAFAATALTKVVDNLGWAFVFFGTIFVFYIIAIACS